VGKMRGKAEQSPTPPNHQESEGSGESIFGVKGLNYKHGPFAPTLFYEPTHRKLKRQNCVQKALVSLKPDSQNLQPKCHQKHNIPKFVSHDFSNFMPAARKSVCSWYGSFVKWVSVHKSGVRYP
jgi:hypothetical protein